MIINDISTENIRVICNSCGNSHKPKEIKLVAINNDTRLEIVEDECSDCDHVKLISSGHLGFIGVDREYCAKSKCVKWYAYFTHKGNLHLRDQADYALEVVKSHHGKSYVEPYDPPRPEGNILSKNIGIIRICIGSVPNSSDTVKE